MITGIFAGITWALETVILGIAIGMSPFVSTPEAILLAPFVSTFLHDLFSALFMIACNAVKGNLRSLIGVFRNADFKWLMLASAIGGPVGMSGYVLAVNHMGSAIGAVASAVYPAVGTVLACIFLKENVRWYQWIFLALTLLGVLGIAEREPNRIARRRCIFASFGALLLARLVSCFAKSHQNLSKMHSPAGASSFDAADFFESKSFSRRAYR
ncbi:MAG: DMT family transporter [Lentisphaeria bacterium]|nr:DMT family transporter [Lentisphaeria bacterium]